MQGFKMHSKITQGNYLAGMMKKSHENKDKSLYHFM